MSILQPQFRVYVTPQIAAGDYGTEVEISDYVQVLSGTITRSIDSTDFSIALFTMNDVQLLVDNSTGYMADESDSRSLFKYTRDLAKIRIDYDNTGGSGTAPITYKGLINDEATQVDLEESTLTLTVLGTDSILRKSQVPANTVTDGMSVTEALTAILDTDDVTSVLNFNLSDINPKNDITVDLGDKFNGVQKQEALTQLLGASNSILLIDASDNIIVRDRAVTAVSPVYLYGKGNQQGKENIQGIRAYNTGLQRVFNSIIITSGNDTSNVPTESHDDTSISLYGLRQKTFSFNWLDAINNPSNVEAIADSLLTEFKWAKREMEVTVATELVAECDLLDRVSIDYPLLVTATGSFLPIIGITEVGDTSSPLPLVSGAVAIVPTWAFKIIEIQHDIESFTSVLKLRQQGETPNDGDF